MRFLVEVNALGQTEAKRYGIEADTWQRALQDTRKLRGEDGPISGFSIELLDDGCRAVDPMARLRYVVKKADASVGLGALEDGVAMVTVRPKPPTSSPSVAPKITLPRPAATPAAPPRPVGAPPSQRPPATAQMVPPSPPTQPMLPSEPPAPRAAPVAPPPSVRGLNVLSRREQAPTTQVPLYYREESVLVAATMSEADIENALRGHLTMLQPELTQRPRGKYVQIAAFDAPPANAKVKPLVVLSWKDWKGAEPSFSYPRRMGTSMAPPPTASRAPSSQNLIKAHEAFEKLGISSAPPPPAAVPASFVAAPPAALPAVAPAVVAPQPAALAPGPASGSPPGAFPPAPPPAAFAPVPAAVAPMPAGPAKIPSSPGIPPVGDHEARRAPAGSSGSFPASDTGRRRALGGDRRVPGEELIAQLFEEMHALHFLNDALEGGHFCLTLALEKLPSAAAYVHLYDIDRREFVIVCTRGTGTEVLLLERTGESDSLLATAMRKRRAVIVNDTGEDPAMHATRFSHLGHAKRIIVTPVMQAGRFLGAIEMVNPLDGAPYTELEGNAMTYMAEQYAEFVAARGVVLEAEKVSRASQAARV